MAIISDVTEHSSKHLARAQRRGKRRCHDSNIEFPETRIVNSRLMMLSPSQLVRARWAV